MPAGCRNLDRTLRGFLSLDLRQIGAVIACLDGAGGGRRQQRRALEMVEQREQIGRGDDLDLARPGRFGTLRFGTDQPSPLARCVDCREQYARRRGHPAIQTKLTDDDVTGKRFGIDDPRRAQHGKRDRQIVMRPFFRQVGRRQIDGDPLGWKRKSQRRDRAADTLTTFVDRFVTQPDDGEVRHT